MWPKGALAILTFHRVLASRDPLLPEEPAVEEFSRRMDVLARYFRVLPLLGAVRRLADGAALPPRAVCITFDDGYANNLEVAAPILAARNLPATVFIAPGFADGTLMFNDLVIEAARNAPGPLDLAELGLGRFDLHDPPSRRQFAISMIGKLKHLPPEERARKAARIAEQAGLANPPRLMMNDGQIRALAAAGLDIGAHTVNHPILACLDPSTARREIAESKERLEALAGKRVRTFAYPNGKMKVDFNETHVRLVREVGFECAVTTEWGAARRGTDRYLLPRIAPWDAGRFRYALRILLSYGQ
jgi:peptidoglycan/xylan/chitin deacetylase (PgdA/CDA1 family)